MAAGLSAFRTEDGRGDGMPGKQGGMAMAHEGERFGVNGFHLLAKPTGAICNLDCTYCFFLSKEMLYPGSRFRMADALLETYIRQLIDAHAGAPEVTVAWQGGEPTLMGVDFFRRSLEHQHRHARPGQRVVNTIQTNGTLIDDSWARFFKENDFLVGLSIDGPPCSQWSTIGPMPGIAPIRLVITVAPQKDIWPQGRT